MANLRPTSGHNRGSGFNPQHAWFVRWLCVNLTNVLYAVIIALVLA